MSRIYRKDNSGDWEYSKEILVCKDDEAIKVCTVCRKMMGIVLRVDNDIEYGVCVDCLKAKKESL
jgi:hypothetical protein